MNFTSNKMGIKFLLFISIITGINSGCISNFRTHAIQCAMVGEQKICFVREVWGFNGDQITLTTNDNVCHQPSKKYDYISGSESGYTVNYAKIENGKIYIYAANLTSPENQFPVGVVFEEYNPMTYFDRDFIKDGYQKIDLSKDNMTWCFRDVF